MSKNVFNLKKRATKEDTISQDDKKTVASFKNFIKKLFSNPNLTEKISEAKQTGDIKPIKIGVYQDINICLIDGDYIKISDYPDFVEGGNDQVYGPNGEVSQFMPENEVWLDANVSEHDLPYICLHEMVERYYMKDHNLKYNHAHDIANLFEVESRRTKEFPVQS